MRINDIELLQSPNPIIEGLLTDAVAQAPHEDPASVRERIRSLLLQHLRERGFRLADEWGQAIAAAPQLLKMAVKGTA